MTRIATIYLDHEELSALKPEMQRLAEANPTVPLWWSLHTLFAEAIIDLEREVYDDDEEVEEDESVDITTNLL